jgi:hypothetical protein
MMMMFNNANGGGGALGGTRGNGTEGLLLGAVGTTSTNGKLINSDEDDIQYDDEEVDPRARGIRGDSPDFNRREYEEDDDKSNLTSTTYDLTVSANNGGHQTVSQRLNTDEGASAVGVSLLTANNQSKTATSTNRTFADSVLNHQYN